jgi:hypothetical protein
MNNTKFYICPMSKNIVDVILEINSPLIGLLPSRRQVEFNGGYVNNWDSKSFSEYIKNKSPKTIIERDHGGIGQNDTDEYSSYTDDTKYFDIVHVDPWKHFTQFNEGLNETVENIKFLSNLNGNLKIEIGTEETIRKFSTEEIDYFISELKYRLTPSQFSQISYVCIQSGVGLDLVNQKNIGVFDLERLKSMVEVCKKHNKLSKEHNGDYLSNEDIRIRFKTGLDSLNIGPEIAQIETSTYLSRMNDEQINLFYNVCLNSKKWIKWVDNNFDLTNKTSLIMVCAHYNFTELQEILGTNTKINELVKEVIKNKVQELLLCLK